MKKIILLTIGLFTGCATITTNYNNPFIDHEETKLLELAKKNNSKIISGYEILINQIPFMLKFFGFKKISKSEMCQIKNQYI